MEICTHLYILTWGKGTVGSFISTLDVILKLSISTNNR